MKSGLNFLVAARQCEIGELEQLARTSELVSVIGRLVHALQRERGISNIFLGSHGQRFGDQRQQQLAECADVERRVREHFSTLDTDASQVRNGARLFSRIAVVLHDLDALPALRQRIDTHALSAQESSAAFFRLIAGLLNVVFEAADSATDPVISRALVALFNFMQGKEFAGQERALGATVFASGSTDAASRLRWQDLIDAQENCMRTFVEFADPAAIAADQASQDATVLAELERLRRLGCSATAGTPVNPEMSQAWYACCTARIDAMRVVEALLAVNLRGLCGQRIEQARAELRDQQAIYESLERQAHADAPAALGPHLQRSVLVILQEQSRRLQDMSDALDVARATLNERKLVERAKGLLMAHRQLSEEEAYKMLRQTAMSQNRRMLEVAESVLAMADVLTVRGR